MTLREAANELKAMKSHIESGFSVVGHDSYYMAIRSLEAWDEVIEELSHIDTVHAPFDEEYEAGAADGVQLSIRTIRKHLQGIEEGR